jgi:hypothetical protein
VSRGRGALLVLLPALLAPGAALLATRATGRLLLPLLATLAVYPVMAILVLRGRPGAAAGAVLLWAIALSASIIVLASRDPAATGAVVLHGSDYRDEMFGYIRDGRGRETDPALFVPQHLVHLGAFVLAALASGGLLGIVMGAALVGWMSYYVGCLAAGGAAGRAILFGWPPWAILRVIAYVLLGVALSRPLLRAAASRLGARLPETAGRAEPRWRWYGTAAALLAADLLLKWLLAPAWAHLLRPCLAP